MKIEIENFNNLTKFDKNFDENKVHFIFGISGSGKSSFSNSLSSPITPKNVSVGKEMSETKVLIDGNAPNYEDNAIYNSDYLKNVLIEKSKTDDVYSIIFSNIDSVASLKSDYQTLISDLLSIKDLIFAEHTKINNLIKELKISFKKGNKEFKQTCKFYLFENNISEIKNLSKCSKKSTEEINWIKKGTTLDDFTKDKCPFCGSNLNKRKIQNLIELSIFDSATYDLIYKNTTVFDDLKIRMPNWKSEREKARFNRELLDILILNDEFEKIIENISYIQKNALTNVELKIEKPSKKLSSVYPDIADKISTTIVSSKKIRDSLVAIKRATNSIISSNIEEINQNLLVLGIPYKFAYTSINDDLKTIDYKIVHNKDSAGLDMTESLSTGEQNLIGLIFFLISNKKRRILIIDDPASSFDEYRRKVIFNLIFKYHEKSTVFVLSHDHVFAKYAAYAKDGISKSILSKFDQTVKDKLGEVIYITSFSGVAVFQEVKFLDFGSLKDFVNESIKMCDQIDFRVALNLRLISEIYKKYLEGSMVYEYLSAIIHRTEYSKITKLISEKGTNEANIIKKINDAFSLNFKKGLESDYLDKIDYSKFTNFEKALALRSRINKKTKCNKEIYDELSNIIHLNESYAVCLNPYKFDYFSKYVYDKINELIK